MSREAPTLISFRDIAHKVRFRQHPKLTACWIWQGYFQNGSAKTGQGVSARQDIHERVLGVRPGGKMAFACGVDECVNPHHVRR